jgi:hypothetical protein
VCQMGSVNWAKISSSLGRASYGVGVYGEMMKDVGRATRREVVRLGFGGFLGFLGVQME